MKAGLIFWGSNFLTSIFLGILSKYDYFWGVEDFLYIFGGSLLILNFLCFFFLLCSVIKFNLTHITTVVKYNGHGI